ncbi:MAG TPA: ATP-binding protein [Halieaceae bacterium]|jgi:DNA helicase HerA-like ATPase|uniref:helicase HerA-like domain-containing protein n=1 Tax=Haliea TaxID=475794 RepID=UPI000C679E29|nr:helicase HerA-like domain-containing protein [Haliea sp.]HBQ40011.1 ATP-binding protein [Halieaceae bacterium]MAD63497.1 ATP-binding protein [Haliea sp.]MAY93435.1 ATP-binding protein [Haliea sp.]MBK41194.1 ATP-binding protein [Haliea sp.]MBP71372.1 ATP-binding protein [Haliea sp.]|tara:strand:+ start:53422 stop:54885 length:1464 start_codon:yes stop_codon:yes gene_type:complete
MSKQILIGGNTDTQCGLLPRYANRHGLIAGATGTGKTVTLQCLAESFSDRGVPVFMADVKGDLSGISQAGTPHPKVDERNQRIGITDYQQRGFPVAFWDVFGELGTPVRTTVTEMGPALLTRLLDLNDTQEGVMNVVFEFADSEGLLLVDLADLRTTLEYLAEHGSDLGAGYGVAKASVNAILRRLLVLEREGGRAFFGEPSLVLSDFMQTTRDGRGVINLLAANTLIQSPRVYSTFLLWLLSELFETLPELGDPEQPVLVFFFDEAHLLFRDVPRALLEKIEQVVRLIRSKGVGVYFISQSPSDIPDAVLGQLGNRIQHALRAYTPREQKAVRVAAQSFRANPALDTVTAITELGVGEALVSMLQDKGIPAPVQRVLIRPPCSRMGPATAQERAAVLGHDPNQRIYANAVDPRSAHEVLRERIEAASAQQAADAGKKRDKSTTRSSSGRQSTSEAFIKSMARSLGSAAGSSLGRKLFRGLLGSLLK